MNASETLVPALLGLGTGLSLIVAIGAQNAFVLRLGIQGHNRTIFIAVLICAISDAVLITGGVLGIGALIRAAPVVLIIIRIVGSGFLITYGCFAAARVVRPRGLHPASVPTTVATRTAVTTVIALTWLNPHVYLDTVIFLGSVANQQGVTERWWWSGGAIAASFIWFFGLGFGARMLRPLFERPRSWRILDGMIALVMLFLGVRMTVGF